MISPFSDSHPGAFAQSGPITQQGGANTAATPPRPRVLALGGAPIIRGAIGEPLRERFDVREVGDAEAAWQAVLLDSSIRVLVGDVMLPTMRTFELIARLRASKVQRIRELPVIVLVGGGNAGDSKRTLELEATELVINDAPAEDIAGELLSRLRVLVELSTTREALIDSRSELDSARTVDPDTELLTLAEFDRQVEKLLSYARRALSDLALICVRVELHAASNQELAGDNENRMKLVGRALSTSVRLEDLATRSDGTEFCVATQNNGMTDMLRFAARLRKVLENVDAAGPGVEVWTCIGVATLSEELRLGATELRHQAQKRAQMAQASRSRRIVLGTSEAARASGFDPNAETGSMDVSLALALIGSGRGAEVVPHLPRLIQQLNPLLRLIRQQQQQHSAGGATPPAPVPGPVASHVAKN
jgi:diguanylate cyclase (GGDEF)-like protein